MSDAEQTALTQSIRQNGVQVPITTTNSGGSEQICEGIARCLSAIELSMAWEQLPKERFEGKEADLLQFIIDRNANRRQLDPSRLAMVAARLATMRQGARTDLAQICAKSQSEAAALLNVSRRLVQYAAKIQNSGVPELQHAVDTGLLHASRAVQITHLLPGDQRLIVSKAIRAKKPSRTFQSLLRNHHSEVRHRDIIAKSLRGKRYSVAVIDFPWERHNVSRIEPPPYPTLTIDEICQYRIEDGRLLRDVIADDALVCIWIVDDLLLDPLQPLPRIMQALGGLGLQCLMPWPKPTIRMGYHARSQHELCLLCTRGNFPAPAEHLRPTTLIVGSNLPGNNGFEYAQPHDNRHSSKPDRLWRKSSRPILNILAVKRSIIRSPLNCLRGTIDRSGTDMDLNISDARKTPTPTSSAFQTKAMMR